MVNLKYDTNTGGFPLGQHLEMILDQCRVNAVKRAIDVHASSQKKLIEIGCGSGIFLRYAIPKYQSVTGIEKDEKIFEFAKKNLSNFSKYDWNLTKIDFKEYVSEAKFDVILCELLSTWCIIEDQVSAMNHAVAAFDMKAASVIPSRVVNLIELAEARFSVDGVEVRTPFLQLTGVAQPVLMSTSVVANELDFSSAKKLPEVIEGSANLVPLADGIVNSVRLSSFVELAPGVNWHSSDTLMPQMVYPLESDVSVARGKAILVDFSIKFGSGLEGARFWVR